MHRTNVAAEELEHSAFVRINREESSAKKTDYWEEQNTDES